MCRVTPLRPLSGGTRGRQDPQGTRRVRWASQTPVCLSEQPRAATAHRQPSPHSRADPWPVAHVLTGRHGRRARLGRLPSPRVPEAHGTRLTTASRAGGAGSWTPDTRARSVPACLPLDDKPVEGTLPVHLLNRVPAPSGGAVRPHLRGAGGPGLAQLQAKVPQGPHHPVGEGPDAVQRRPTHRRAQGRGWGCRGRAPAPEEKEAGTSAASPQPGLGCCHGHLPTVALMRHREAVPGARAPAGPQRCHRALLLPPP